MSDEVKALIAEARTHTACECHFEGVQMRGCGEHGDDESKLIADLADALEAAQPQGEYHEGLEEGIKIGRAEAAQQAPAVDREALVKLLQSEGVVGGNVVASEIIASGVLQDAAEVEARGLEKAAGIARAYKSHPTALDQADHIASILVERAQQVREANA